MTQKPFIRHSIALACAVLTTYTHQAHAQAKDDGTYYDAATGLTWMRCLVGQTWANGTCTGTATTHTFDQANAMTGKVSFAGQNDWRVPNIRELLSIVDYSKADPALDATIFPNASTRGGWLSLWSSNALDFSSAWSVSFVHINFNPSSTRTTRDSIGSVRMVRSGQSSALLNPARPDADYQDHSDGTVTHKPTGLMWKRCKEGQSWNGSTCTGDASRYASWDAAKAITSTFAGQTDWRLPTIQELQSLVDYTKYRPPLNTTMFPNAGVDSVWSGSLVAYDSSRAWVVYFTHPVTDHESRSETYGNTVRLVRTLPLTTDINCLLNWAESRFATLFSPANSATQTAGTISYRAYAGNVFLGVDSSSDAVLVLGGSFGNTPVNVGKMADYLPTARAASCK